MSELSIGPVNAASPTPLDSEGNLDTPSTKRLCQRWIDLQLDGVLLLGSMGEGPWLADRTRNALVETAIAEVGDQLTLFASAADLSRQRSIERARRYANLGAPCIVLCLTPGVSVDRAIADVHAAAEASPVPCAFYDIPARTGITLSLERLLEVLGHENIVALKDSTGNSLTAQAMTSPEFRPQGVALLDGSEYHTAYSAALGYDGVLHGGGALTGRWVRTIWEHAKAGRMDEAVAQDRQKALCLGHIYNRFTGPLQNTIGQKYALQLLGILDAPEVAIDQSLDDASRKRIGQALEQYRQWLK